MMFRYNRTMFYYIEFYICNLIFDFSASVIYKKIFSLRCKNLYLLLLQIFSLAVSTLYLFCGLSLLVLLVLKMAMALLICLLTVEEYGFKNITIKWLTFVALIFIVFGLYCFLSLFYFEVFNAITKQKIAKTYKIIIILAIFMQYAAIFCINSALKKNKEIKKSLAKIEFSVLGEHIKLTGLIDSGNSLYDSKTKLPVIVISRLTLLKKLQLHNYENITKILSSARCEECVIADGSVLSVPIFEAQNTTIDYGNGKELVDCVFGVVKKDLAADRRFECLIHKDFM